MLEVVAAAARAWAAPSFVAYVSFRPGAVAIARNPDPSPNPSTSSRKASRKGPDGAPEDDVASAASAAAASAAAAGGGLGGASQEPWGLPPRLRAPGLAWRLGRFTLRAAPLERDLDLGLLSGSTGGGRAAGDGGPRGGPGGGGEKGGHWTLCKALPSTAGSLLLEFERCRRVAVGDLGETMPPQNQNTSSSESDAFVGSRPLVPARLLPCSQAFTDKTAAKSAAQGSPGPSGGGGSAVVWACLVLYREMADGSCGEGRGQAGFRLTHTTPAPKELSELHPSKHASA